MKKTFWGLISHNSVEIPIIQRDYAQGRKEEQRIAENFVNVLYNSIAQRQKLSLDFIYGKTKDEIFIPLDGQQRLTTLWLLHWYLAAKENRLNSDDVKKNLLKFSYETRLTSQDFCKKLVEESITFPNSDKSVSEVIKDAKWFYLSWEQDPTVAGMLNMLDIIHDKFKNEENNYFDALISEDSPVEFYFLNLEEFSLTDELYIKMNARGKPLTPFEYFKAQFSELLMNNESRKKLDNTWMDIFWNVEKTANSDIHPQNVETKYYNFFENIVLLIYVEDRDIDKEFFDNYDLLSFFDKDKSDRVIFNDKNIENIGRTLDRLSNYRETIFTDFLKPHRSRAGEGEEKNEINYWERCRFYSLYQFFIAQGAVNSQNDAVYKRWMRITKNLINNTRIDEPADFYRAIRSLKKLAQNEQNIEDIYGYFRICSSSENVDFFYKRQVEEEKLKAHLILEDNTWEPLILEIENYSYFDGQIGFILEFARDNNTYNKGKFKDYSDKLRKLFSDFKDSKDSEDFLFQRALLTMGDYIVPIRSNYTFCNFEEGLRAKMDNWRKVFNDPQKVGYIKKLLDQISLSNMEEDLKNIIDNYNDKDWRYFFIKNPKVLEYCTQKQIRWIENPENNDYPEIYLLSGIRMSSRHEELYSYYLFQTYLGDKAQYTYSQSYDSLPCITLSSGDKTVRIETQKDTFEFSSNDKKEKLPIKEVVDKLEKTPLPNLFYEIMNL